LTWLDEAQSGLGGDPPYVGRIQARLLCKGEATSQGATFYVQ
jgi:hypothetical protein